MSTKLKRRCSQIGEEISRIVQGSTEKYYSQWSNKMQIQTKNKEEESIKEEPAEFTKCAQQYEIDAEFTDEGGYTNSSFEEEGAEENESVENDVEEDEERCNLNSICGLKEVKQNLLNIFIYPILYPTLFPRSIRWNKILLYGPPGTGKTMLAKAIAKEINATLYRITSADVLSHWQGESEKQIKKLFENVRENPEPIILFFDEIDGLCRRRTSTEEDSVRRIKTELLTQLDGSVSDLHMHQIYVIGATNCPWEIDSGFMRRFHKKIFVPLPDKEARLDIIKKSFDDVETELTEFEWDDVGKSTEGYSGSDLVNLVMSSCCERFTQIKNCKYWKVKDDLLVPADLNSSFALQMNFEDIHPTKIGIRNIIFSDLKAAIANTPKTVGREEMFKYLEFSTKIK